MKLVEREAKYIEFVIKQDITDSANPVTAFSLNLTAKEITGEH
jgi:hypothetical protein